MNTSSSKLPILGQFNPGNSSARPDKAIVFVHGIYSSHDTFVPLKNALIADAAFNFWNFFWFDYNFSQHISESGKQLAELLVGKFGSQPQAPEVTLVCHSMGGLVGRLALLQQGDRLQFVKRLVMLGTPNHGTLQTARLAMLAYMMRGLWAVCSRKPGLKELTQVGAAVGEHLNQAERLNTLHVEYVTIPGMYFNEDTEWFRAGPPGTSRGLRIINRLTQAFPLAKVGLSPPHDGIVAADSVNLVSDDPSRFSERQDCYQSDGGAGGYAHILHRDYRMVDHITVHSCARTIEVLSKLLLCKNVGVWKQLQNLKGYKFKP